MVWLESFGGTLGVVSSLQLAGFSLFFAGIAVGLLLVFADRHQYERPVSITVVLVLLGAGVILLLAAVLVRLLPG